jgi:hypothetical protein
MAGEFPEFGMGIMRNIAERLGRSAGAFKELRPFFQT